MTIENMDKTNLENLKILSINLDDELNAIGCDVIALNDIRTLVSELRVEMDNTDVENAKFYFNKIHRSVRVISEFCVRAMGNLNKNHAAAEEIKQEIFNNAISYEKGK